MKRFVVLLTAILSLLAPATACFGSGLPVTTPDQVGLSAERLGRIGTVLRSDVERGRISGAVILVARRGKVAYLEAVGYRDKAAGTPMTTDAIFRLASMTKPIVTVAALSLAEEGRLLLSDPVSKFIPALAKRQVGIERKDPATGQTTLVTVPADREMTVQDLMRHTSGLTYGNRGTSQLHKMYPESSNWASLNLTSAEFIERLDKALLLHQPGTTWDYSLSTDVLGLVVEAVSGKPLGVFLDERIYKPLRMTDTAFVVPADKRERIAQPLAVHPDTEKPYVLHDPTVPRKFDCGGGCAVSTAGDYARFAQMLLNRGTLDGARVLGVKTVQHMTSDHLGPAMARGTFAGTGYTWGLGVAVREDNGLASIPGSAGDFYWPGAFATYFWVDPKEELVAVSLLQAPFGRHYNQLVRHLVLQAILE